MASTTRSYVNVERGVGDGPQFFVHAYSILTTDTVMFDVYEAASGFDSHGTTTFRDERHLGAVRTRRPHDAILALQYGEKRTSRVLDHYRSNERLCHEIIMAAFPEIMFAGRFADGHASVTLDQFHSLVQS